MDFDTNEKEPEEIIDELMHNFGVKIITDDLPDEIHNLTTSSYCNGWGFSTYEIKQAEFKDEDEINFTVDMEFSGEPEDNAPKHLDTIRADITGKAFRNKYFDTWKIDDTYTVSNPLYGIDYEAKKNETS